MKHLRLFTVLAVLLGLSMPAFAQDPPADPPATTDTTSSSDTADAPDTTSEDKPKADSPEKENGDAVASTGNAPNDTTPKAETDKSSDPTKQSALSKLADDLMAILIPAFLALVGMLVTFILNWVRKKFKLNVSDAQIASWAALAERAANRGAEWARNKARDMTDGKKVPGPEILEVAVDWAVEMGRSLKLPEMGREKLVGLIESHLAARRKDPGDPLPLEDKPDAEPA